MTCRFLVVFAAFFAACTTTTSVRPLPNGEYRIWANPPDGSLCTAQRSEKECIELADGMIHKKARETCKGQKPKRIYDCHWDQLEMAEARSCRVQC